MNQKFVLKKNQDIEALVSKKSSVGSKYYAIYFDKTCSDTKIAVSVSKKCGSSPERNYEKRVVREIIRTNLLEKMNGYECLFVIKKEAKNLAYEEKKVEIEKLVEKLLNKNN